MTRQRALEKQPESIKETSKNKSNVARGVSTSLFVNSLLPTSNKREERINFLTISFQRS